MACGLSEATISNVISHVIGVINFVSFYSPYVIAKSVVLISKFDTANESA